MNFVTFEQWMEILKRCAERYNIVLKSEACAHRNFYDSGDTPYGAVMIIRDFGY